MKAASIGDYRELARRRLPRFLFEYIDGGSYSETTLRRNVADLQDIALRQRVLRDVSNIDLSATLFGQKSALPVALAPIGLAGMNARRGEVQAAGGGRASACPSPCRRFPPVRSRRWSRDHRHRSGSSST
jgi:L-lactate dehydrogenase (cytochrome)